MPIINADTRRPGQPLFHVAHVSRQPNGHVTLERMGSVYADSITDARNMAAILNFVPARTLQVWQGEA